MLDFGSVFLSPRWKEIPQGRTNPASLHHENYAVVEILAGLTCYDDRFAHLTSTTKLIDLCLRMMGNATIGTLAMT